MTDTSAAEIESAITEAVAKYEAVIDEAKFLRDRISEMEWNDDEVFRQFDGLVAPSISRLKDAITALDGESNDD